jgi:hypothetical protein
MPRCRACEPMYAICSAMAGNFNSAYNRMHAFDTTNQPLRLSTSRESCFVQGSWNGQSIAEIAEFPQGTQRGMMGMTSGSRFPSFLGGLRASSATSAMN